MASYQFLDEKGTFTLETPENYSYQYFPVAGENGIKSAVTPNLGGDSKINQNVFILEPVSVENLHNNRSTRNFWCQVEGVGSWSVTGASAEEESRKFTDSQDESELTAGLMWQSVTRKSRKYQLEAKVTSFVPLNHNVEIMHVEITNAAKMRVEFTPIAAVPIYGRSADNIRDHRHVTALLHRISTREEGVVVKPTLSFDERGHQVNDVSYFVCGVTGDGKNPVSFYPIAEDYIGEGGSYTRPLAVIENQPGVKAGTELEGKEAVGGLKFDKVALEPGEYVSYTILIGALENQDEITGIVEAYNSAEKVETALNDTKNYWQEKVNITYHTGDKNFDNYMRWVSFQPILRRIYGCSFLPHHDYGKGGRGWRDLWQDCLALLLMNPDGVRQMLLDNFGGVRMDGTNATIIGSKQGEFIADRNNITRVWMDHGVWPFFTTKLYIDQTGDIELLNQKVTYFKDKQVERGTAVDEKWSEDYGNQQKTADGTVYSGTVLEHLLLQNLCAFYEVGEHNHIKLRGADWNDALDMADKRGESVAFTNAYAGNLRDIADYAELLAKATGNDEVVIAEEMLNLLKNDEELLENIEAKNKLLSQYGQECRHTISGKTVSVKVSELAENLRKKSDWMMEHIRKTEWVTDKEGNGWFNGYYDNSGRRVEGDHENGVRMMLTGQVFSIMSGTATEDQIKEITKSADMYLYNKKQGGYRLNTDFHEVKKDLGRMFGFAYGEKENGAVFSHMAVMYANALYRRGFAKEGHKALQALADAAMDFETSKIYPGIPEYFNATGRGMYHYLTGAASWYMLTMITEGYGVKGSVGNLEISPNLMKNQFDEAGNAGLELPFGGKRFRIVIENPEGLEFGEYSIKAAVMEGRTLEITNKAKQGCAVLDKQMIDKLSDETHRIEVTLGRAEA
ncbi:MAG: cellobiose phosphorylase [Lachnospiraceae bacterium]|nr:cellobiose phosphorylase [Lachnospiraceae bacterium]